MKVLVMSALLAVLALVGCSKEKVAEVPPKDGELSLPSDYSDWPVFISGIEKSSGHIRDIYVSKEGADIAKGSPFPAGTQFVMEIYNANKDAQGKLSKADLAKVFVMAKGDGYGQDAVPKTGEWVYTAFDGAGNKLDVGYEACRGCHVPLVATDFIFHYEQYFENKASGY